MKEFKFFNAEIKGVDVESKTLTAVVSTINEDRDGDVILPEAFKNRLTDYMKHPVLLSSHDYYDLRKQIGMAEDIQVGEKEVRVRFKYFAGQGNEEADWAWVLAQKGIAAFSIGFIGHAYDWLKTIDPETGREYISGRKFTDIELMEISQVLVPSNRQALQLSVEFAEGKKALCEMVSKSFASGELKEVEVKAKEPAALETKKADPEAQPEKPEEKHHTEVILGEGTKESAPALNKDELVAMIKETIANKLKKEKV